MPKPSRESTGNNRMDFNNSIRRHAKDLIKKQNLSKEVLKKFTQDAMKNMQELQVYQIELEMLNEQLQQACLLEKEALERYNDFYEFAPTGFFSLTNTGKISQMNTTGMRLIGCQKETLLNYYFDTFVANSHKSIFYTFLHQMFSTKVKQSCELVLVKENSQTLIVQIEGKLSLDGKEGRTVIVDITARKEAEKILNDQQFKLLSYAKSFALGEMTSSIAHEINNPLTIMMTKVFLIQDYISSMPNNIGEIKKELKDIEVTINQIAKIIKSLKSFSQRSDNAPFLIIKLSHIINDSLELCQEKIRAQNISFFISSYEDIYIKCKAPSLSQVLLNLINNSIDTIQNFEKKWIKIEISRAGDKVVIKIMDSRNHISKENTQKMMEPFFITKEEEKARELGLSISKEIIEEIGGQLRYETSAENMCFTIELPISE